ncbi:DUF3592 domain-containing protein [Amycolatopsis sp. DSM 110486]|uniref:DUF3592 domain-containing protein n=1 Tax=Amycolatopsis sp. DSM 110486 TaxID=2865832 RepID=UPI001C6A06B8|nr:DUF3592 domain-containing protein [Amycolatopsis sp. DSM 110486]QYN16969.1 hypothetical protein K1T34_29475 [Amycolatopsis sp. DSM 110486]
MRTAVAWLVVLLTGGTGVLLTGFAGEALLTRGARADGEVTAVSEEVVIVDYVVTGVSLRAVIDHISDHRYVAGETVPVFYDPADPHTARLRDDVNLSLGMMAPSLLLVLTSLAAIPIEVAYVVGWARRRGSPWYPATAIVLPLRLRPDAPEVFHTLEFVLPGGVTIEAKTTSVLPRRYAFLRHRGRREVWVSGSGRTLAVVLPVGPRDGEPSAIPFRLASTSKWTLA